MLLAIDTSTSWASVALFDGRRVLGELTWHSARRSGDELFPMLERLLAVGDTSLARVDRLAVATGPGSFTGIRVGIAAARGLARPTGATVTGVSTLDVIAFPHVAASRSVCALLPAGRDDWYAARYEASDGVMVRRSPIENGSLEELCASVAEPTLFTGEFDADVERRVRALVGRRAAFPPASLRLRRAGHLADLAWRAIEAATAASAADLEPIYVKQASVGGAAGVA